MAADDEKIGLKAEIDVAMVEAAAAAYAKAIAKMEDQTDSSGDAMSSSFDAVEKAWNSLSGGIDTGKEIITGALRKVGEIAVGALGDAASALWDFAKDSLAGAIDAQKGLDELNATIEHLGDAAPITSERALELADQFKNLAGGSDDAVLAAEKVLLRFDKIGSDAFPRVLEQSADLATLFGGDMSKGAEVIGKVLQDISTDGVGSIGKLKAAGVQLTDAQEKQILAMVKAGDVAGAQNAVLDALAATTGGAAAAASETLAGRWDIFKESIADAGEGVALQLMPYLERVADVVLPAITGAVDTFLPVLNDLTSAFGGFIADIFGGDLENAFTYLGESSVLQGLFKSMGIDVLDALAAIEPFANALYGIGAAVIYVVTNLAGGGGLVETLQGLRDFSWDDMFGPDVGSMIVQVIDGITQFVVDVQTNLPIVQKAFTDAWATIQPALAELWGVIVNEVMPSIGSLTSDVNVQLPSIKQIFEVVSQAITIAARGFTDFLTNVAIPVIRSVTEFVVANWPTIQATIETVMAAVGDVIDQVLQGAQDFWHTWGDDIQAFTDKIFAAVKDIFSAFSKAFSGDWRGFGEDLRKAWDKIWAAIQEAAQTAIDAILAIDWGSVGDGIAKGIAAGLDAALQWVVDAAVNIARAALDAAKGFLGINSPSTEFKWVGEMSGLGWVKGLEQMAPHLVAATRDVFGALPAVALEGIPELADKAIAAVSSPMKSLIEDIFGPLSGAVATSGQALGSLVDPTSLESIMPIVPQNVGVAGRAGDTRNITNNYYYSPTYGSAPVAPQLDFAVMRVFHGA